MDAVDAPLWPGCPLPVGDLATRSVAHAAEAAGRLASACGAPARIEVAPQLVGPAFEAMAHLRIDGRAPQPWAPFSGFFPAADAWVRLHGNYPHHARSISRALDAGDRGALAARLHELTADDAVRRILAAGGVATRVRSMEEWTAHPQARATECDPWWQVEPAADRTPHPAGTARASGAGHAPLAGIRVLDLTRVIAGPTASQLLACLGADVLRIDPPRSPELLDQYLAGAMGKRSAVVDLGDHGARVHALLPTADVVLLGYRPGALTRFGLDPEQLTARYPHLVIGSLSAWGETGPWGRREGFDSIVQAASGIAMICADESGAPGALPVQALDFSTGFHLAAEVMGLLADGHGGVVRISLLGAARALLRAPPSDAPDSTGGADTVPTLMELRTPHGSVDTVPVPITRNGRALSAPITGYGAAPVQWAD